MDESPVDRFNTLSLVVTCPVSVGTWKRGKPAVSALGSCLDRRFTTRDFGAGDMVMPHEHER